MDLLSIWFVLELANKGSTFSGILLGIRAGFGAESLGSLPLLPPPPQVSCNHLSVQLFWRQIIRSEFVRNIWMTTEGSFLGIFWLVAQQWYTKAPRVFFSVLYSLYLKQLNLPDTKASNPNPLFQRGKKHKMSFLRGQLSDKLCCSYCQIDTRRWGYFFTFCCKKQAFFSTGVMKNNAYPNYDREKFLTPGSPEAAPPETIKKSLEISAH